MILTLALNLSFNFAELNFDFYYENFRNEDLTQVTFQ